MYREFHEKEGKKFTGKDRAYIHMEMWDGRVDSFVTGDAVGALYSIMTVLNTIAFETGNTFDDAIEMIKQMHDDMIREVTG